MAAAPLAPKRRVEDQCSITDPGPNNRISLPQCHELNEHSRTEDLVIATNSKRTSIHTNNDQSDGANSKAVCVLSVLPVLLNMQIFGCSGRSHMVEDVQD